jgi:uncharacterized membrane protein YkvA (DUF1232 family)
LNIKSQLSRIAESLKIELAVYQLVLKHPCTPRMAKLLLWLAIGYVLMPFDLIPDFLPVIGQVDDLLIVPALIYWALKIVPAEVMRTCRAQVEESRQS